MEPKMMAQFAWNFCKDNSPYERLLMIQELESKFCLMCGEKRGNCKHARMVEIQKTLFRHD
jgi:hypothetical protein